MLNVYMEERSGRSDTRTSIGNITHIGKNVNSFLEGVSLLVKYYAHAVDNLRFLWYNILLRELLVF